VNLRCRHRDRFLAFFVLICLAACYNKPQPGINNDGINECTTLFSDMESETSYKRWCELCDSMLACGNRLMPNQYSTFLEKGCKLNKEQKVFSTLFPLYNVGDTIYILEEINTNTATVLFAFWNGKSGNVYGSDKVYEYRYMRYQEKGILNEGEKMICDSVFIKNDPGIFSFSEKLKYTVGTVPTV